MNRRRPMAHLITDEQWAPTRSDVRNALLFLAVIVVVLGMGLR